jgi:hypothetical protein
VRVVIIKAKIIKRSSRLLLIRLSIKRYKDTKKITAKVDMTTDGSPARNISVRTMPKSTKIL